MAVIYLITNTINGKQYVGETTRTAVARYCQHIESAFRLSETKRNSFYREIAECGESALLVFKYAILETCDDTLRFERERYWINKLKCEYNEQQKESYIKSCGAQISSEYADGKTMQELSKKYRCRQSTIKQILLSHNVSIRKHQAVGKKKIYEFNSVGNLINEHANTSECSLITGIDKGNIRTCALSNSSSGTIRFSAGNRWFSYLSETPKDIVIISDKNGTIYKFKTINEIKFFLKTNNGEKARWSYLSRAYYCNERKTAYGYNVLYVDETVYKKKEINL